MNINKNISIKGKHQKPILTDLFFVKNNVNKKIVIFCHGYKGYKDWGAWNLVAQEFAKNDLFFVKMNFSHNGGTLQQPIDFPDLEAFGNNNFTIELDDLKSVIDYLTEEKSLKNEINTDDITLIGHSRGGGTVLIKASEDKRVSKVITWAGVSDFAMRFPTGEVLEIWKKNGIAHITNARTNQEMPHYFQFYLNFKENEDRLTIKNAVQALQIPYLIIHGSKDETVSLQEAKNLRGWNQKNKLIIIEEANHTFGSSQPWNSNSIPEDLEKVIKQTLKFIHS